MNRPQPDEFSPFYKNYIASIDDDVIAKLNSQATEVPDFLRSIPAEKWDYAYAENKWTIRETIGHVIDTERIMTYRLTRFARNDSTTLPGFDENDYVANAHFKDRTSESLIEEFKLLRQSNLYLFNSLNDEELSRKGISNNNPLSVKALLFIIAGHANHHQNIISERYL